MANFQRSFGQGDKNATQKLTTDDSTGGVSSKPAEKKEDSNVNQDVWAEAERAARSLSGGFGGTNDEGKQRQIQKQYDQMMENDKNLRKWAGKDNVILGNV